MIRSKKFQNKKITVKHALELGLRIGEWNKLGPTCGYYSLYDYDWHWAGSTINYNRNWYPDKADVGF